LSPPTEIGDTGTLAVVTAESDDRSTVDDVADAAAALEAARSRLTAVPAEVVVTNHAFGLYELAAIHLSAAEPDLDSARLAIDALAHLVDGLGSRLGAEHATLVEALSTLRMAYVSVPAPGRADG
jgi:hypothetical protein